MAKENNFSEESVAWPTGLCVTPHLRPLTGSAHTGLSAVPPTAPGPPQLWASSHQPSAWSTLPPGVSCDLLAN